ncbi:alpha-farnesene synthase [Eucalyptus grandis]|uniref:alpha-farnesene synthase n=1 Tax=Eucalyptus grandis TaxID=71139 RepID=UPI00192E7D0C|nr:alpha-farnesene synthase [Eucalyptus grandis]
MAVGEYHSLSQHAKGSQSQDRLECFGVLDDEDVGETDSAHGAPIRKNLPICPLDNYRRYYISECPLPEVAKADRVEQRRGQSLSDGVLQQKTDMLRNRLAAYRAEGVWDNPTVEEISSGCNSILADGLEESTNFGNYLHRPNLPPETLISPKEGIEQRMERLMEDVKPMFPKAVDSLAKLELIDRMRKMGLSNLFDNEMKEALETVASTKNGIFDMENHVYARALRFRLLRQHGYVVSQDEMRSFKEESKTFNRSNCEDVEAMMQLLEASHLAVEGENILDEGKAFSTGILRERVSSLDGRLLKCAVHALELPMHRRLQWFDVKWQIDLYEQQEDKQSNLLELAKLNFNTVQATHRRDLIEISRWWRDLGLIEHVDFTRDRPVESFLCALGLSQEPRFSSLRKSLTKVIIFILVIDDVYDLYGSLEELECFTSVVTRWDSEPIQQLPECMKFCFRALHDLTYEIAHEIGKEEDWHRVLPHLMKAWADFCKALLTEAKWDHLGYTPSLEEYLSNAWTSSSGPLLLSHAYFFVGHMKLEDAAELVESKKDLIYNASMIIRLCNDLRTSKAEIERGDAPSSMVCYMREANVSEDIARKHIKGLIDQAWKNINAHCFVNAETPFLRPYIDVTVNAARAAYMIYQSGDGFGVQDGTIGQQMLSAVIEPLALD